MANIPKLGSAPVVNSRRQRRYTERLEESSQQAEEQKPKLERRRHKERRQRQLKVALDRRQGPRRGRWRKTESKVTADGRIGRHINTKA